MNLTLSNRHDTETRPRVAAITSALGLAAAGPLAPLPALPKAAEPLPCRLTTQQLVELLKYPTCLGELRQVILRHLGHRYGRTFRNHWEFVRYAEEHHLGLDLKSPPKRPKPEDLFAQPEKP